MFFLKTKKKIDNLAKEINELKEFIKNKEYEKLKKDSIDYKELLELIKKINIQVEKIDVVESENFDFPIMRIKYKVPNAVISFNEDGEPIKNDLFYALNYLELISIEDMKKITDVLEKIRKGGKS